MAERIIIERPPKRRFFHPDWWHSHGTKMDLNEQESTTDQIILNSKVARLVIAKINNPNDLPFNISWSIVRFRGEETNGNRKMDLDNFLAAFGFDNRTPHGSEWLIQKYGGSCAEQGTFIRYDRFLNIPHPGTGNDGDPNISVLLNREIQQAIISLLPKNEAFSLRTRTHIGEIIPL